MTWFKVDDGFWSHPKTATLSDAAVTLWVRAGAYSCQHLTDGVIAKPVLRLVGVESAAGELVDAGLWIEHPDGWVFHDWDDYQETRDAVRKRRDDWRDRQKRSRERAEQKRRESRSESHDMSRVTDGVTTGVSQGVPSRPVPSRPVHIEEPKGSSLSLSSDESDNRGTLIPDEWRPNQKHIDKAASLRLDVKREYQRFRANAEAKHRRQRNWNAAFTNWLRKGAEFNQQRQGQPAPTTFAQQRDANAISLVEQYAKEEAHAALGNGDAPDVRALSAGR